MRGAILLTSGAFGLWELDALHELRLVGAPPCILGPGLCMPASAGP